MSKLTRSVRLIASPPRRHPSFGNDHLESTHYQPPLMAPLPLSAAPPVSSPDPIKATPRIPEPCHPSPARPLPLLASLAHPHRQALATTSVHHRRPHSFNAPPTLTHGEEPPELLSLFLNSRRALTHRSGPERELR
jgi:hypothetical protein